MKLDKYKLLEDTDDHFRLDDGSGKPFLVAKKGLGKGLHERIVQHFAHGGQVMDAARAMTQGSVFRPDVLGLAGAVQPAPPTVYDPAMPTASAAQPEMGFWDQVTAGASRAPGQPADPNTPVPALSDLLSSGASSLASGARDFYRQAEAGAARREHVPGEAAPAAPGVPVAAAVPVAQPAVAPMPQPQPQPQAMPPPTGGVGLPGMGAPPPSAGTAGIASALKATEEGIRAQGATVKAQAQAEMDLRTQQEAQRQTLANEYQRRLGEHQARGDELFQNILAQKVDPNRLWGSKSTGQKLGSLAAIVMSGIGQSFQAAGGMNAPNMALQIAEQAIDRDIDAQKADIAKGQGLLAHHAQGGRDMQSNYLLTKADMLDGFAGQVQKTASQFAGQKADADVQLAIGQAREKAAQLRAQVANTDFERWYKMQQLGIEAGKLGGAGGPDKETKQTLAEVEGRYRTINGALNRVGSMIKDKGTWEGFGGHNKKLDQELTSIANDAAKISDPKSVNREAEVEMWKGLLGSPGFWSKNSTVEEVLQHFRGMVEERRNTAYQVRGMGEMVPPPSLQPGRR